MKLSEYLKPTLEWSSLPLSGYGYYWFEHRPHAERRKHRAKRW